jgi:HK97 family phage major capsid protein
LLLIGGPTSTPTVRSGGDMEAVRSKRQPALALPLSSILPRLGFTSNLSCRTSAIQRRRRILLVHYLEKHYGSRWQPSEPMTGSVSLKAALGEASVVTGGYAVPLKYARRIMRLVIEDSLIRPGAQKEPMDSKTLHVPLLDVSSVQSTGTSPFVGGLTWTWNQEAQTRTETEPQFKHVELAANELGGQVILSRPVKDDGKLQGEALDAFLFTLFAEGISYYEDYNFLQGNGVGKPLGILNAAAALAVNRANGNQIAYADVSGMIAKLPPSSFNDAYFVTHPTAFPQLLQLKDGFFQMLCN